MSGSCNIPPASSSGEGRRSLLEFPCDFPIKVMGAAEEGFDLLVAEIVRRHAPDLGEGAIALRASSGGRFVSVTVTITARSQEQLDAIYQELTAHSRVMMAL